MGRHLAVLAAGGTGHREDPSRKFKNSSSDLPLADLMPVRLWPWSGYKTGPYCGPYGRVLIQPQSEYSWDKETDSTRAHCWTVLLDSEIP